MTNANSARGYQSTSYLTGMDIRYGLGPFQNASKRSIWGYMTLARTVLLRTVNVARTVLLAGFENHTDEVPSHGRSHPHAPCMFH